MLRHEVIVAHNPFARLLGRLAWLVVHRRHWFVWPQIALFVLCTVYTVKVSEFDTSRSSLVGADKRYHRNFLQFKKEFAARDDLVVVGEREPREEPAVRRALEHEAWRGAATGNTGASGAKETVATNLFSHIFCKGDLKMLAPKRCCLCRKTKLVELKKRSDEYRPLIQPFTRTTNLVTLIDMINTQFGKAKAERNEQTESLLRALLALERIVNQAVSSLRRGGIPPSPGYSPCLTRIMRPNKCVHHLGGRADLSDHRPTRRSRDGEASGGTCGR